MAEFKTVMSERGRMCSCLICKHCGLYFENNGHGMNCSDFVRKYLEEAEDIIMQWSSEHPIMTNREKFEEVFGKDLFKLCTKDPWGDVVKWLDEEYKGENKNG